MHVARKHTNPLSISTLWNMKNVFLTAFGGRHEEHAWNMLSKLLSGGGAFRHKYIEDA